MAVVSMVRVGRWLKNVLMGVFLVIGARVVGFIADVMDLVENGDFEASTWTLCTNTQIKQQRNDPAIIE